MEQKRNQNYLQNGQSHRETSDRPDSQNRDSHESIINTTGRNNCGGRCLIHVHMKDGKIERLTTETQAEAGNAVPLCACVRGMNYHKTFLDEEKRLKYPMKRVGERGEGKFERITWEEAVDTIAKEWIRIRDTYGPGSRYVNYATGISGLLRGNTMAKRLLNLDGGFLDYYNSYSTACIRQATSLMYGTSCSGHDPRDWVNSHLIILWGHNPDETKFDSVTMYTLLEAKKKGIPIVVIDPRKSDTVLKLGAEWIPLKPATDSALMDGMAYAIVEAGLEDREFLDRCCVGFDKEHMPEGIDPSECYLSYLTGEKDGIPNPYGKMIPVYCWTDAVDHGTEMTELDGVKPIGREMKLNEKMHLDANIKMIFNLAGNSLVNQHGDINRTIKILKDPSKCEFIVCSDLFMTASAKFADILLPGVSMFECENITMPWQYGDFLGFNNQVMEPLFEGRFEYDWLVEVADRLGLKAQFSLGRTAGQWLQDCYEKLRETETELPDYGIFKKDALFRYQERPIIPAFEKQCQDPEANPFPTRSGKIEIFSETVYRTNYKEFFPAIPRYVKPPEGPDDVLAEKYPLQLIGWHTKRRCHSIHDSNEAMHKIDPQHLWMNLKDAAARNLKEGETVLVWNDRGKVEIPVYITDRIAAGVVALSQGAWYRPDPNGIDQAGSINVLTSLHPTPYARGNAQHTNLVEVRGVKWEGEKKGK